MKYNMSDKIQNVLINRAVVMHHSALKAMLYIRHLCKA